MQAPLSRLRGGAYVGTGYFGRPSVETGEQQRPSGIVDRLEDLAHPGAAVDGVDRRVRAFFEDTASLELHVVPRWSPLFWPGALVFRLVATLMGQLRLPLRTARILTRVSAFDAARDGRTGARAVVRVYEDGRVMQVIAYATHRAPVPLLGVALPVPGGNLCGLLQLEREGEAGATLSSGGDQGAGIWLTLFGLRMRLPFGETMAMWPAGAAEAPADLDPAVFPGSTIVGSHEQRLLGVVFVRHAYWFRPIVPGRP